MEIDDKVFAINKGTTKDKRYNIGIFIGIIVVIMKKYKKNGKFREYYENGDLKYMKEISKMMNIMMIMNNFFLKMEKFM